MPTRPTAVGPSPTTKVGHPPGPDRTTLAVYGECYPNARGRGPTTRAAYGASAAVHIVHHPYGGTGGARDGHKSTYREGDASEGESVLEWKSTTHRRGACCSCRPVGLGSERLVFSALGALYLPRPCLATTTALRCTPSRRRRATRRAYPGRTYIIVTVLYCAVLCCAVTSLLLMLMLRLRLRNMNTRERANERTNEGDTKQRESEHEQTREERIDRMNVIRLPRYDGRIAPVAGIMTPHITTHRLDIFWHCIALCVWAHRTRRGWRLAHEKSTYERGNDFTTPQRWTGKTFVVRLADS